MKELKKRKGKILMCIFLIVILSILVLQLSTKNQGFIYKILGQNKLESESNVSILSDDFGIVDSADIIQCITGTGPFDDSEGPGNDTSADDLIVRTFDQVSYTVEATMSINSKHGSQELNANNSFVGGYLNIKGTLPENCDGKVKWDLNSMKWAEDANISDNGRTITAKYKMSESKITVPGKQSLILVATVTKAENGLKFKPDISMWLNGNETDLSSSECEIAKVNNTNEITVSAAPKYNIVLNQNKSLNQRVNLDYDNKNVYGRVYGYGVSIQLYNDNESKGIKGIQILDGKINFDINMQMERKNFSKEIVDISDQCNPILWNYKNNTDSSGNIENRKMDFSQAALYYLYLPYGNRNFGSEYGVCNSGNITMNQNKNSMSVEISNYDIDELFPTYSVYSTIDKSYSVKYSKNIGFISTNYFEIFVPDCEALNEEMSSYNFSVSDSNLKINNTNIIQQKNDDDITTTQYVKYTKGLNSQGLMLYNKNNKMIQSYYNIGDGKIQKGQQFIVRSEVRQEYAKDIGTEIRAVDRFIKFDGDGIEPDLYEDNSRYRFYSNPTTDMTWKMWYTTKKDGTNWNSQDERNKADIKDMNLYEKLTNIPNGYICTGIYYESQGGKLDLPPNPDSQLFTIPFKTKDSAKIGKTYGITQSSTYWSQSLDRTTQSITNPNAVYPEADYDFKYCNYINTEYDKSGQIISGTHNGNWVYGQSILIISADVGISNEIADINEDGSIKNKYDVSKNEYDVTFKLSPTLDQELQKNVNPISNANIKIIDTLPKGLKYETGTSSTGNDPQITNNSDGTTTLIWEIYNCIANTKITPITFKAHIDENSKNGTQYENKVVVECSDIGMTNIVFRTSKTSLQVINLNSHSFYKQTDQDVVELNQMLHYKVTYKNNTDSIIKNFQLLDILPYNGDKRGTKYNGTYNLNSVKIEEKVNDEIITNNNLKVYVTNDVSVRTGVTAKDTDLGTNKMWNELQDLSNLGNEEKGIAIIGEINPYAELTVDFYLKPNDNQPEDIYINSAECQVNANTFKMQSADVSINVIKRQLDGIVWLDENKDGCMQNNEEKLKDIELNLIKSDGTKALDINGREIKSIKTDENGYYKFDNISKGQYVVEANISEYYKITDKLVGSNNQVNSKFNVDTKKTDIIDQLNENNSKFVNIQNQNCGLYVNTQEIDVKKIWKDDNNKYQKRPQNLIIELYKNNDKIDEQSLNEKNNWSYIFNNLEKYDYKTGNKNTYKVKEKESNKDDLKLYSSAEKVENISDNIENIILTNTYTIPKGTIQITAKKNWDDADDLNKKRPKEIKFVLKKNNKEILNHIVNLENNWEYTFTNLPEYDSETSEKNMYTIEEEQVSVDDLEFYTQTKKIITNDNSSINIEFTNSYTDSNNKIEIKAKKIWKDDNNQYKKRPQKIRLVLLNKDIVVDEHIISDEENWEYIFKNILKNDKDGNEIKYQIKEEPLKLDDMRFYINEGNVDVKNEEATIINTFSVPKDKVKVIVNKKWDDNDNEYQKRPESIIIDLKSIASDNANKIEDKEIELTEKNGWQYTYTDLPKYDSNGNEIEYKVVEKEKNKDDLLNYESSNYRCIIKNDEINIQLENKLNKTSIKKFNFKIEKYVYSTIINEKEQLAENGKLSKVDISSKEISTIKLKIKYKLKITNTQQVDGTAKVYENIPKGFKYLEDQNEIWNKDGENLTCEVQLKAGESKEIYITYDWENDQNNFGLKRNDVKIIPKNPENMPETTTEDNYDNADIIITIKTGKKEKAYTIIIIQFISICTIIITKKIKK